MQRHAEAALLSAKRPARPAGQAVLPRTCSSLHRAHFAFMRAVLQGIDPADSWRRYLAVADERVDLRLVKATLQWIRDEFAAAAQREHRPGTARLVRLDAQQALLDAPAVPSLEEFIADAGLEDFSQEEQIQAYQERHGSLANRRQRSQRLLDRQLSALRWLESLASRAPRPSDPVQHWLHPLLADKLATVGLDTLEKLLTHIQTRGNHWFQNIRGIGAGKAARIVQWLRMQEVALNQTVSALADRPLRSHSPELRQSIVPRGFGVLPLEKLVLPPALSGQRGSNRAPRDHCRIPADDDLQALQIWLGPPPPPQAGRRGATAPEQRPRHTHRTYRKEAERLLLWAVLERNKPLSSLTAEDARDYLSFLARPTPAERWCSNQKHERWSPAWRPFNGALSLASIAHAARVLRVLFRFLADQGYVEARLFDDSDIDAAIGPRTRSTVHPRQAMAAHLLSLPNALPKDHPLAWRLSVCAAALPQLRLRQLCEARLCDLVLEDPTDPAGWCLQLPPVRGRAPAAIPLPAHVIQLLQEQLGIVAPNWRPGLPVHPNWRLFEQRPRGRHSKGRRVFAQGRGIQPGTLRDQLRAWCRQTNTGARGSLVTELSHS